MKKNNLSRLAAAFALASIAHASSAATPIDLGTFTVDSVELKREFCGKLGPRLRETLTLVQGDRRFVLAFKPERERFLRGGKRQAGEVVKIRGEISGDRIVAERKDVVAAAAVSSSPTK